MLMIVLQTMSKLVSHLFIFLTVVNFISILTIYFHFHPINFGGGGGDGNASTPQQLQPKSPTQQQNSLETVVKLSNNQTNVFGFRQIFRQTKSIEISTFLGIPYAKVPIGELRFRPPQKSSNYDEIQAFDWPNPCLQSNQNRLRLMNSNFSEDCLYLNIWTPVSLNSKNDVTANHRTLKPVLVLIHTGAFLFGSASEQTYNGVALSAMADLVVVTFNYRLNFYGFFYTGDDDSGRVTPNVGMLDQVAALEWIQSNIVQFGGDPERVTLLGQASGALSAGMLLTSPLGTQLFQQAILMSGSPLQTSHLSQPDKVLQFWNNYAKELNCSNQNPDYSKKISQDTIQCIQSKLELDRQLLPTMKMVKGLSSDSLFVNIPIVFDAHFRPPTIESMKKSMKPKSLLFGYTDDEGSWIAALDDPEKFGPNSLSSTVGTIDEAQQLIRSFLSKIIKSNTQLSINDTRVLEYYLEQRYKAEMDNIDQKVQTSTEDSEASEEEEYQFIDNTKQSNIILKRLVTSVLGDYYIKCPAVHFADQLLLSLSGKQNSKFEIHQYRWNYKGNPRTSMFWNTFSNVWCGEWMGSCHSFEMFAVFGIPFQIGASGFDESDQIVSSKSIQMVHYFTHNNGKLFWPKFSQNKDGTMEKWFYSIDSSIGDATFGKNLDQDVCHNVWEM